MWEGGHRAWGEESLKSNQANKGGRSINQFCASTRPGGRSSPLGRGGCWIQVGQGNSTPCVTAPSLDTGQLFRHHQGQTMEAFPCYYWGLQEEIVNLVRDGLAAWGAPLVLGFSNPSGVAPIHTISVSCARHCRMQRFTTVAAVFIQARILGHKHSSSQWAGTRTGTGSN